MSGKSTEARLRDLIRAAEESGKTVVRADVEGKKIRLEFAHAQKADDIDLVNWGTMR